ncbi:MAG: S-layer homology domain-containing protein [Oscillospiraceae bacterium]|nr:S-layer homology domain-containing protein [Oscillospiraceae bacterium]
MKRFSYVLLICLLIGLLIPATVAIANPDTNANPSPIVVTFSGNGGLPATQTQYAYSGDPYATVLGQIASPTRTGFTFLGWYTTAQTGGSQITELTLITQEVAHTLYARWEQSRVPIFRDDLTLTRTHFAYLVGSGGDRIDPGPITRAEVATILLRMLSDESRGANWTRNNPFQDVPNNGEQWFSNAVSTVHNAGLLNGPSATQFAPMQHITRAEAAVIMTRFLDPSMRYQGTTDQFPDIANNWARDAINLAGWLNWMTPDQTGRFNPNQPVTRAEFSVLVNRVLGRTMDNIDPTTMRLWSDNTDRNAWFFNALQIATNSQPNAPIRNWVALQLPNALPEHVNLP